MNELTKNGSPETWPERNRWYLLKSLQRMGLEGYAVSESSADGVFEVYDNDNRMVACGPAQDVINGLAKTHGVRPAGERVRTSLDKIPEIKLRKKDQSQELVQEIKQQVEAATGGKKNSKATVNVVTVQLQIGELIITDARQVAQVLAPDVVDALAEAVQEKLTFNQPPTDEPE